MKGHGSVLVLPTPSQNIRGCTKERLLLGRQCVGVSALSLVTSVHFMLLLSNLFAVLHMDHIYFRFKNKIEKKKVNVDEVECNCVSAVSNEVSTNINN